MTKTKRALLMSALALTLCVSMLIGSTFAWFTDSVTSANNIIKSGNLDLTLEYWDGSKWVDVQGSSEILDKDALYEPGYVQVAYLKLNNAGSLALKYQLGVNIIKETVGVNQAGAEFKLSDYIQFGIIEGVDPETAAYTDRKVAVAALADSKVISAGYNKASFLLADAEPLYLAMVIYMPETVDNAANHNGKDVPFIELGINAYATQMVNESDSFGTNYDENAPWTGHVNTSWYNTTDKAFTISSAEELAGLAQIVNSGKDTFVGKEIKLDKNINLNDIAWTPIGNNRDGWNNKFNGTFIGTDYTISNLYVVGTSGVGLFGYVGSAAHIEGVTIDGAYVKGNDYVGAVLGTGYLAANCLKNNTVKNAEIIAEPYLMADGKTYDGGAKAGAVAGYAINGNVTGNKAINCTVTAYRDLGGIVGMAAGENRNIVVSGNEVNGLTLTYTSVQPYAENKVNENKGGIVGRYDSAKVTVENNTETNVKGLADEWDGTVDTSWYDPANPQTSYEISTAEQVAGLAELVDDGNTFEGKTIKLDTDMDLKGKLFEPIGSYRKDTAFKGTFDGQGYTISNLFQNTWELDNGYYYGDLGLGLFGKVEDATIKDLNMDGASLSGESAIVGIVAATAYGECTFENITVTNSQGADYQYYAGGIVGWASGDHQYINCDVDASTTIAAQWGDFDNSTGGIIGGAGGSATILLKDCDVACRIDAYNDVTSSYQWYAYRRCGMLIGNPGKTVVKDGTTYADAPQLTCENVTVTYGDWANYTYCEFAGTSWPYVRVQAGVSNSAYSNPRYGHPKDANGNEVVDDNHVHNDGEDHQILCVFDQLYGGGQGVYGWPTHDGVTVIYNNK